MKSFLYTLVAVAALTLGGVFSSTAVAGHPSFGYHPGHVHSQQFRGPYYGGPVYGYRGVPHHHHHGHYHHGYRPPVVYRYAPVYRQPQSGIFLGGQNFGIRIGF